MKMLVILVLVSIGFVENLPYCLTLVSNYHAYDCTNPWTHPYLWSIPAGTCKTRILFAKNSLVSFKHSADCKSFLVFNHTTKCEGKPTTVVDLPSYEPSQCSHPSPGVNVTFTRLSVAAASTPKADLCRRTIRTYNNTKAKCNGTLQQFFTDDWYWPCAPITQRGTVWGRKLSADCSVLEFYNNLECSGTPNFTSNFAKPCFCEDGWCGESTVSRVVQ
mmetsp:Transcript_133879/g.189190  ORF Transcript_133879/g.189190 Transcript_133879/m.189190 type:complete len:218 (-) Transcript_133879:9-662(-)